MAKRVELDGKTYEVRNGRVYLITKTGPRTLNGHGRAYRPELAARVIEAARKADCGGYAVVREVVADAKAEVSTWPKWKKPTGLQAA